MEIAAGAAALGKLAGTTRVTLAVPEDLNSQSVARLRAAANVTGVRLYPLKTEYPLAHPSLLVRRILRRRLPQGQLPTQIGVLLLDAPAAIAMALWFIHGEAMQKVPIGIHERNRSKPHLGWIPSGTKLSNVLTTLEIDPVRHEFRAGQMLRDQAVTSEYVLGPGELTVFISEPHPAPAISACLPACGYASKACPVNIHPAGLLDAAQQNDPEMARQYGLKSCIECGICSYVCPSRLPLLNSIRALPVRLTPMGKTHQRQ